MDFGLSFEQKTSLLQSLKEYSITSSEKKKEARSLLWRLNLYKLGENGADPPSYYLESVIDNDAHLWNFVLTAKRKPNKTETGLRREKRFQKSGFPLTQNIAKMSKWASNALQENFEKQTVPCAIELWDLEVKDGKPRARS